jgi:hypothetical protein
VPAFPSCPNVVKVITIDYKTIDIILKNGQINGAHHCSFCLVNTVSGNCKNTLGRPSASREHITKLEQYTFL